MISKYFRQTYIVVVLLCLSVGIGGALLGWILLTYTSLHLNFAFIIAGVVSVVFGIILSCFAAKKLSVPLIVLAQKVEHVTAQETTLEPAESSFGSELIDHALESLHSLLTQTQQASQQTTSTAQQIARTLNVLPYPVLGLDHQKKIVLANQATAELLKTETAQALLGQDVDETLPLEKDGTRILPHWIEAQQKGAVNAEQQWPEVVFNTKDRQEYNFDVWSRYVRAEQGVETSVMLVDRTLERQHEDMKVDFVAMAAHDLRAPVTVIRGYIETITDELETTMNEEQKNYMEKLNASAAQLSGFINNILNVAKVDKGSLNLSLQEGEWGTILRQAIDQLQIRAKTHGKIIEAHIDNALPHVAVDPVSIIEVINNFVDNAIKYSGKDSNKIVINSKLNSKSEVETTITDFGVGIPANLVGKLFTKYYRSHRTQKHFGGTGLGLFISKAIVEAHYGQVWAQSKEGEGSTFGFSLPPYDKIAAKIRESDTVDISRGTHGWIKNHSLYRR